MRVAYLLLFSSGCVLAVEDDFCVSEPVDEIIVDISNGDLEILTADRLCVAVDVGGLSTGEVGYRVRDGVLTLDYGCNVCGGDLVVNAPAGILIDVAMGAGDLSMSGREGDVYAAIGAGEITARRMASSHAELATGAGSVRGTWDTRPDWIDIVVAAGEIDLAVPSGEYVLDLEGKAGKIEVSGITENADADAQITALNAAGAIRIHGE